MAKHINITDDIKNKIIDFTHGDDKYWKNKFKDVLKELEVCWYALDVAWCNFVGAPRVCLYCEGRPEWNDKHYKYMSLLWNQLSPLFRKYMLEEHRKKPFKIWYSICGCSN